MPHFLVTDIGGSKTRFSIFTEEGALINFTSFNTLNDKDPYAYMDYLKSKIFNIYKSLNLALDDIKGLGVCVAGFYQHETGVIINSPNLPGWENFPLKKELEKIFGSKILVENDANAAAWGEYIYSLKSKPDNMIYVTISTGIGSGVIINGKIFRGENGIAGEIGHLKIGDRLRECHCGGRGCLEQVASGEAITRIAKEKILTNKQESILQGKNLLDTKAVFLAAKEGDNVAFSIINESIRCLALGLSHSINLFNPGFVILGGGVMKEYNYILPLLNSHLKEFVIKPTFQSVQIQKAGLDNESGLYGMLALLKD